jgi:hypothetical protein
MVEEVENPHRVGIARRKRDAPLAQLQARVLGRDTLRAPAVLPLAAIVERRIGQQIVRLDVGQHVVEIRVAQFDFAVEPMNEKIPAAKAVREILTFLSDETEFVIVTCELVGLHEHAAGAAARVEDHAALRLQHRYQRADDGHGREVLAATLALR